MTQYARPDADLYNSEGWTSPAWSRIDEDCASYDGVFAQSPSKADALLTCTLSDVTDPSSSSSHTMRVRGYVNTNGTATIVISLYCGATTLIKQWTPAWTGSSAEYSYGLSSTEANNITDYTDLRVWFQFDYTSGSRGQGFIDCFQFECPDAPTSTTSMIWQKKSKTYLRR